jgi:hypothetical protein
LIRLASIENPSPPTRPAAIHTIAHEADVELLYAPIISGDDRPTDFLIGPRTRRTRSRDFVGLRST